MAKLSAHQSGQFTKLMLIGDSGTGKTGSLASLVPDYNLRVLDFDNGLDILKAFVLRNCPERLDSVDFESVRDEYKASDRLGAVITKPTAYTDASKLMTKWSDDTIPGNWGKDTIFVLDSLTTMGKAAFEWAKAINAAGGNNDQRAWYGTAQSALENVIAMITSEAFETNVIVISHVNYDEANGLSRGYPTTIGKALGPKIARYFNNMVVAESTGTGDKVRRTIRVVPNDLIDIKTAAPFAFDAKALPLETGMADLFRALRA
jgi:hypothetical protein